MQRKNHARDGTHIKAFLYILRIIKGYEIPERTDSYFHPLLVIFTYILHLLAYLLLTEFSLSVFLWLIKYEWKCNFWVEVVSTSAYFVTVSLPDSDCSVNLALGGRTTTIQLQSPSRPEVLNCQHTVALTGILLSICIKTGIRQSVYHLEKCGLFCWVRTLGFTEPNHKQGD